MRRVPDIVRRRDQRTPVPYGRPLRMHGVRSGSNLQLLMGGDEVVVPAMRGAEAQQDLPAATNDVGSGVHEGEAEAFPLPAHDLGREGEQGDPLAEVPSQSGDLEPRTV